MKKIDTQYRIDNNKYKYLIKQGFKPVEIDYFIEALKYEAKKVFKK